jgi:serine O-acetyltransferase
VAREVANGSGLVVAIRKVVATPVAKMYNLAKASQTTIDADVSKWAERNDLDAQSTAQLLPTLLVGWPEFRNVFYFRLEADSRLLAILVKLARQWLPPLAFLDISSPEIGPGLVVSHGFGTILNAKRIGQNFWVHHQVTIGWDQPAKDGGHPTIGDDVFVGAGAKIFGSITVGDGARIGANAVVMRDVPAGATAVGVPAKIIERKA